MSIATSRDLNGLIDPIPGPSPVGADPRSDSTVVPEFQALRDARNEARRIERQAADEGIEPTDALPLWRTINELARNLLTSRAKDLEAACYLLEAWVRLQGFGGLRGGLMLLRELVQQYWEAIFPQPEDGEDPSARARFIDRLSGPLPEAMLRVPITAAGSVGPIATWQYRQATDLSHYSDREREERVRRGAVTLEIVERAAAETEAQFFQALLADLDGSLVELRAMDAALLERCGAADAPATSIIAETIEQIQGAVRGLAGDRISAAAETAETAGTPGVAASEMGTAPSGPLRTREDAFRALQQVAEFFERMDPQSLLAAHIRRILRLGKMSTVEYFTEILEDQTARAQLFKLLGLTPPKPPE